MPPCRARSAPGEYLVVAASTVMVDANATLIKFAPRPTTSRTAIPTRVAIINKTTGEVVDALSYGGSITAAIITGITGTRNLVEGTATTAKDSNTVAGLADPQPERHGQRQRDDRLDLHHHRHPGQRQHQDPVVPIPTVFRGILSDSPTCYDC